jgi:endonuclease/exonuclease/phosphatase family metal-dependent hydrolase
MTLLTWNLLADAHVRPKFYPLVDPEDLDPGVRWARILAALAATDADVLCLQEVPPERLDAIRTALAPRQIAHAAHLGEGVAIASRRPFFGVEAPTAGRKRSLVVTLAGGLRIACVHLRWTGPPAPGGPTGVRPGAEQLAGVLRFEPHVVAGDFNAFPDWPERRLAREAGYVDIGPDAPTCNVNRWLQPLDTVLVRPPLTGRADPVPAITEEEPMPSPIHPSDHLPVRVRIDV